jgi:hydrogenase maturation protein HypF
VLAIDAFVDAIERLQRIVDVRPSCIGVDQHPDYASSRWAESQGLPMEVVQHHHAHLAACLAEHQEQGPVLGLALDGTGLGTDGAIWGGELLVADLLTFQRLGHLAYVPMPGGDQAARQPWRMAVSYLVDAFDDEWLLHCPSALRKIPQERIEAIAQISKTGTLTPMTSSTGRLFDGVAALCGLTLESRFEAEAAMKLEMTARQALQDQTIWHVNLNEIDGVLQLQPSRLIRCIVEELAQGTPVERVAVRFHRSLAKAWVDACVRCGEKTGLTTVVLSGGSIQNTILSELLAEGLSERGFRVLLPIQTPPNDGGIALGQAIVARCRLQRQ